MPPYLPLHNELIAITGCFEILFALLLLHSSTRRIGAWGIIVLLIAVYPANIQMTIDYYRENNPLLWLSILRLPLQFVLMWWAYGFTKPADAK